MWDYRRLGILEQVFFLVSKKGTILGIIQASTVEVPERDVGCKVLCYGAHKGIAMVFIVSIEYV